MTKRQHCLEWPFPFTFHAKTAIQNFYKNVKKKKKKKFITKCNIFLVETKCPWTNNASTFGGSGVNSWHHK